MRSATQAWGSYWASGVGHSCPGSYGERYGGAIAEHWRQAFRTLRPGQRVLDIATGNGALPRLLLDEPALKGVAIDGVDLAELHPVWWHVLAAADQARCRFHSGVSATSLPFADASMDMVVSQYGMEYAGLERAASEALRVLNPQGSLVLVTHHAQGRPVQLAHVERQHLQFLHVCGLFECAEAMLEPLWRAGSAEGRASLDRDPKALAARERFNNCLGILSKRLADSPQAEALTEARDAALQVLAGVQGAGLPGSYSALQHLQQAYADAALRLDDLIRCAPEDAQIQAVMEAVRSHLGRPVHLATLSEGPHLMGWALSTLP